MVLQQAVLFLLVARALVHVAVAHRRRRAHHAVAPELGELPSPGLRGPPRRRAAELVDEREAEGGGGDRVGAGVGEALLLGVLLWSLACFVFLVLLQMVLLL